MMYTTHFSFLPVFIFVSVLLADRTAVRSMIVYWHNTVIVGLIVRL